MSTEITHMITTSPQYLLTPADLDYWMHDEADDSFSPIRPVHNSFWDDDDDATEFQLFSDQLETNGAVQRGGVIPQKELNNETPMIRRRSGSRVSKKTTPTIHLNATAKNFKDLVHRYTACPQKRFSGGPVTICFDQGLVLRHQMIRQRHYKEEKITDNDYLRQQNRSTSLLKSCATAGAASFHQPNRMSMNHDLCDMDLESNKEQINGDCWFDLLLRGEISLPAL